MNAAIDLLAFIALAIVAIRQQLAVRRLRHEIRALRRDHHDAHGWYEMLFEGLQHRPALMSPSTINESRMAR
ncbi:hypothetical protein [Sphingomonas cynarae]|uniref:hypothetical protein n=1 Tax=Sphingomonas cynarae TaxID=930197 RepID=UPI0031D0A06E